MRQGHDLMAEVRCAVNRFVIVCECGESFRSDHGALMAGLAWADHASAENLIGEAS